MTVRIRVLVMSMGTFLWMALIGYLSGLFTKLQASDISFIVGLTLGMSAAALIPAGAVALMFFAIHRDAEQGMRWWMLLGSLLAIFLALGCFVLEDGALL